MGNHVETKYDRASRITDIITNWGETVLSYGYDDANRKVWEDQTLSGHPTRRVETPRDPDGNRGALQVGAQYYVSYGYTQRNQLQDIYNVCHFTYDQSGNMTGREGRWLYTNAANFVYDSVNRMTQAEQGGANGWIFARSHYQYDSNSRETATRRDEQSSKGEWFDYNPNNQLKKVHYNADQVWTGSPQNREREVAYAYTPDTLNQQSVNDNGVVTEYGVSDMNQYTSITGQGAHYDNNFNLWFLNGGYVEYDADKRARSVTVNGSELLRCTYDGLGRVVRRTESGTTTLFTYDEWNQILEWDEWGNCKAWNIYGARPDAILARNDAVFGPLIYKQDKLGNVVALLDGGGEIKEQYTYDVFGQPKVTDQYGNDHGGASWYGNRFMFTGREYLAWIACYDYRNRLYRPSLGRYLQTDPIGFAAGDMNLFRYVSDDPVDKTDPMGLADVLPPAGMDELGYQAVMNARAASKSSGDQWGKSQAIVERRGNLVLSTDARGRPLIGYAAESREFRMVSGRLQAFEYHLEKAPYLKGDRPRGDGHYHKDKTGKETKDFSDVDHQRAREGLWIYKANESSPNRVERLTPQTDGTQAKARLVLPPSDTSAQNVEPPKRLSPAEWPDGAPSGSASTSGPPMTRTSPL